VVDRVHCDTANARALAEPAVAAGLAELDAAVLVVADLADRRAAARVDDADLAGSAIRTGASFSASPAGGAATPTKSRPRSPAAARTSAVAPGAATT
jgi:hypothetical protein